LLAQTKTPKVCEVLVFWGPMFYIGFLRINLEVEFSRPKNGKIIVNDVKYYFQMKIPLV
jgi:hypothetical protein